LSKSSAQGFIANVLKLVGGSAIAQGLVVLTAPIVTRLFAPEAFGIAALFTSITSVLIVVSCLQYELAIMLPDTDAEAANLLGLSVLGVLAISGLSGLVVLLASDWIIKAFAAPNLGKYLWLIPPAVFIGGLFTALNHWNSRSKHFGRLSVARVVSSTVTQSTKIGAGLTGFVSGGVLIVTRILGMFVSTGLLLSLIWKNDHVLFKKDIRLKYIIAGLRRYKEFPIYSTWSALITSVSQHFPVWILAYYFPTTVVGLFSLGRTVVMLPLGMVGNAITMVFFQKTAEALHQTDELPRVVEQVFMRLLTFGSFLFFMLSVIGKDVFIVAFGSKWSEAGVYTQILAVWMLTFFITSPISSLFYVFEKQAAFLVAMIIILSLQAAALIFGGMIGHPRLALAIFSGVSTLTTLFLCIWLLSLANVPISRTLSEFGRLVKYIVPLLGITALAKWVLALPPLGVVLIGCCNLAIYYAIVLRKDKAIMENLTVLLKRFDHT